MRIITVADQSRFPAERLYDQASPADIDFIFGGLTYMASHYRSCTGQTQEVRADVAEMYVPSGCVSVRVAIPNSGLTTAEIRTEVGGESAVLRRYNASFFYRHGAHEEEASASYELRVDSGRRLHPNKSYWIYGRRSSPMPVQNNATILVYNYLALLCRQPAFEIKDETRASTLLLTLGFPPPDTAQA